MARLTNELVREYTKSKEFKNWVGETPEELHLIVDKFNKLAELNQQFDDSYVPSFEPKKKYVYIKCK